MSRLQILTLNWTNQSEVARMKYHLKTVLLLIISKHCWNIASVYHLILGYITKYGKAKSVYCILINHFVCRTLYAPLTNMNVTKIFRLMIPDV